jgi:hypothetical protein
VILQTQNSVTITTTIYHNLAISARPAGDTGPKEVPYVTFLLAGVAERTNEPREQ